ncbi:hypothetical protein H696_03310 [Fonticula alba]|uniref:Uncharacterized protein n=1 Tax=Fonticula alba TaxID=691883 RepID=A0A058Z8I0_FONAL|nr:hypothetical protein H696_03310 [Fonticula alba]KCV69837.1 hypothetical protein H696_03310 [Fonticula alba]|eukprot:XP_009495443.1 hypothetical protein H696_03310 [Fonticula alba]
MRRPPPVPGPASARHFAARGHRHQAFARAATTRGAPAPAGQLLFSMPGPNRDP